MDFQDPVDSEETWTQARKDTVLSAADRFAGRPVFSVFLPVQGIRVAPWVSDPWSFCRVR